MLQTVKDACKFDPKAIDYAQFTGSETWWRHALVRDIVFTDGAKHVADAGGASLHNLANELLEPGPRVRDQFDVVFFGRPFFMTLRRRMEHTLGDPI